MGERVKRLLSAALAAVLLSGGTAAASELPVTVLEAGGSPANPAASAGPVLQPDAGSGLQTAAMSNPNRIVPIETLKPAAPMSKPVLSPSGGTLILSNSPESPTSAGGFYRDTVSGSFRIFSHQANMTGSLLNVAAAVTNTSGYKVKLYEEGTGAGIDYYPDQAGQNALDAFLKSRGYKRPIAVLEPGETYWKTYAVPSSDTLTSYLQLRAESAAGGNAPVTVTTLGYAGQRPANPLAEPMLPPDKHVRGTFPHYDRTGTLVYNTSAGNSLIRVSSAPSGQWADFMPGEYENGRDAISGATVVNSGNYGVIYDLSVQINNESDKRRTIGVYLNAAGGSGHYTIGWGGKLLNSGYLDFTKAWQFAELKVSRKGKTIPSRLSLTGGSSGPQALYFTNQ
ncbi:hypothetical protein M3223_21795 [Paenibacillus pasadenensis]|uniref:hypothetical protein n=1 Tax=Paenibacillus pasadenensis TaxID=217090 RepID=UPI002040C7DE|nr:hypothetical protein [Paenibacillus pasadenensis]MCM3749972.1 hypothetical protein [Paenibacillus pasadenensis]